MDQLTNIGAKSVSDCRDTEIKVEAFLNYDVDFGCPAEILIEKVQQLQLKFMAPGFIQLVQEDDRMYCFFTTEPINQGIAKKILRQINTDTFIQDGKKLQQWLQTH